MIMEIWVRIENGYQSEVNGDVILDESIHQFFAGSICESVAEELLALKPERTGMLLFPVMRICGWANLKEGEMGNLVF